MFDLELLKMLSEEKAISGFEYNFKNKVQSIINDFGCDSFVDGLGSVIGTKCIDNNGPKIMIAAHMDEVGFMIKDIDQQGFLKLSPIGSWWSHMLLGQTFVVTTKNNESFNGIISSIATHGLAVEIREKTISMDNIYLDLGVSSIEMVKKLGIEIGDMVTPLCQFTTMNDKKFICGKALDDRVGIYIGLQVLKNLSNKKHCPLFFAATVQEEPGLRGARTATEMVCPDIAFAIDTTLAGDTPLNTNICKLGNGVTLSMLDSNSIAHRGLVKFVESVCFANNIEFQYAVFNKGGTDSGNIHKSFNGVINMTLSVPIRYMHTNQSIIHQDDIESCIKLLTIIIKEMNEDIYNQL